MDLGGFGEKITGTLGSFRMIYLMVLGLKKIKRITK